MTSGTGAGRRFGSPASGCTVWPGLGRLRSLVMSVLPTGTAMPGPSPATTESMVTPNTGGASPAFGGGSWLGGGGASGGGDGARRATTRGRGSGGGGGGGGSGLMSGGG